MPEPQTTATTAGENEKKKSMAIFLITLMQIIEERGFLWDLGKNVAIEMGIWGKSHFRKDMVPFPWEGGPTYKNIMFFKVNTQCEIYVGLKILINA